LIENKFDLLTSIHMKTISEELKQIIELELKLGNLIERIDEPAGSQCPKAIIFKNKLHLDKIRRLKLSADIKFWENHDAHYPLECGFNSTSTKETIVGPLTLPTA